MKIGDLQAKKHPVQFLDNLLHKKHSKLLNLIILKKLQLILDGLPSNYKNLLIYHNQKEFQTVEKAVISIKHL